MEHKEVKKPIPTPRRSVTNRSANTGSPSLEPKPKVDPIKEEEQKVSENGEKMPLKEEYNNTISRRLTKTKQIAGEIGQLVTDRKNAVIEGTRQSVRRIRRRFSSISQERQGSESEKSNDLEENEVPCDMFNNIKFDSPLNRSTSIYSNVEMEYDSDGSNGSLNLPPPNHPPPPLPDESYYDAPSSITSSSNSGGSNGIRRDNKQNYESVFPIRRPKSEESESSVEETDGCTGLRNGKVDLSRSESWAFQDVSQDHIYGNQPARKLPRRPPVSYENAVANHKQAIEDSLINKVVSQLMENARLKVESEERNEHSEIKDLTSTEKDEPGNSSQSVSSGSSSGKAGSYENCEIVTRNNKESGKPRASKSVLLQFDPLNEAEESESVTSHPLPDIKLLEELLQGDLYGTISEAHTLDDWSISNESDTEEFFNPPTPPLRFDSLPEDGEPQGETSENTESQESTDATKEKPPDLPKKPQKSASKNPERPQRRKSKIAKSSKPQENASRTSWFLDDGNNNNQKTEGKKNWFQQVIEVVEKAPFKSAPTKACFVDRPVLGGSSLVHKKGMLYKVQGGPVEDLFGEYSGRWCVLENSSFVCYSDNTCMHTKEHFPAQNILSVQILQDAKYKYRYDNDDLHCFELNTTGKARGGHIYGSRNISERRIWMQMIAEMLTQRFKSRLTTNFVRMGWAYLREGVSGKWVGAWILLSERELHYAVDRHSVKTMDLRKARCIVLQALQPEESYPKTNDKGPNMLVDCPEVTLYLRMWTGRETKVWCHIVKREAHNNGANIDQQQLTKNDIPVIVEKCINFIYAHGSMSEGIYRKAGQGSSIADLMSKFRKDAFSVQLTKNNSTEFEVATALKRFFRDLPEPLLGCDHRQYLCEVAKHNDHEEKIRMFKAALDQLPTVSYKTCRKLLGHLHFISNQSAKNRMTVENLAAIWGPTLMHYEDKDKPKNVNNTHQQEVEVVCQLIKFYRHIFPEDPGELEKEKIMLKVLEKHAQSPQGVTANRKTTGDFRVWIYVFSKEGKSFNISVGANKTAYEICLEICEKIKSQVHEIVLEEVVLGDRLVRPIHHEEKNVNNRAANGEVCYRHCMREDDNLLLKMIIRLHAISVLVLDIVLDWVYWDEADRKDNYLLVSNLSKYWEYMIDKPLPVSGELKYADSKSRLFKNMHFQFSQGILMCFKDKTGEVVLNSWPIEEMVWYLGHESKRNPQSRWTMTFLKAKTTPNRTKTNPYFGHILVFSDAASRAAWLSAMLKARYPNNFAPPPKLLAI